MTISTLEYITSSPDVPDTLLQVIAETTDLVETLQGSDPITMFLPRSFEDLDTTLSTEEMIDLIQNHIFDGMTFSDVLAEMDGGVITSINSKPWVVSVLDGSIFLGNEDSGDVVNVGPDVDILTKTGVVHKIDGLLSVVDNLTEAPTTTPTVIETDSPTEEPVPVPESTRAPAVETDEPTRAPAVETDEPTRAPAVETDRPTQLPSDTTTNNNPSVESNPPDGSVIVPINASFAVYNTQNLLSTTLVSRYNGEILNAAFSNFVDALVTEVEGGQQRKLRRLEATLVRDSPEIYAVRMVLCTAIDAAPNDAICHNVYGSFNLAVVGENADAVTRRYEVSANRAIEAGDLQASFDKTDLSFPFIVVGPAVPADRQASSDEKMPWWILIIIILLSIVAVGCLLFACATLFLQHKPDNRDESEAFLDQNEKRETSDDSTGNKEEDEDEEQVRLEKKSEKETLMNDPKAALSDSQGSEKESVSLESESETEHVERNGPFEESEVRSGSAHKEEEEREKSAPMSQSPLQGSTHVEFRPDGSEEMEISARDDIGHKEDQDLQDINLGTEEWEDEPIPQASWGEDAKLDSWGEDVPNGAEDENISWDDVDASTPAEDASWDENGNGDDDDDENISKLQDELGAFDRRVSSDPDQMNKGLEDDSGRGEAVLDFSPSPNSKTESSQELSKPGDNSFDSSWTEDEEPGIVGLKEGLTELNAEMDGFDKHFLP